MSASNGNGRPREHLFALGEGPWALWREVCLRGAGFPASQALKLASEPASAAADRLLSLEVEAEEARQEAIECLIEEESLAEAGERHAVLDKACKKVKLGKLPARLGEEYESDLPVEQWRELRVLVESAREEYRREFDAARDDASATLAEVARSKPFREAVMWQNREALHLGIDALLSMPTEKHMRGAARRQRERLVASYVQRYCTKNDTIGFFGPSGWARLADEGEALTVRPGRALIAARNVFFEGWCLDTLAGALAKDERLMPWVAPRRAPFVRLEGAMLVMPFGRRMPLPLAHAAVMRACDGARTAREVASLLLADPACGALTEADVFSIIERLQQGGALNWKLDVPWTLDFPRERKLEVNLRRLLGRVGDDGLRREMLGRLDELEAARDEVAAAAGDDCRLDGALGRLDEIFTRLTGTAATRKGGQTYAGRTLVYEDCRRDIDVELGPDIVKALDAPLCLLLASARWFTAEVATLYRHAFEEIYRELASASGSKSVSSADFWMRAYPLLFDENRRLVDRLIPEFQQRWADVLDIPDGLSRVEYSCAQLRERVLAAFPAARPGWPYARYHCPDLMLAASDVEAVRRGEFKLVLGEVHIGLNTLGASYFVGQHPSPETLFRALDLDVPEPRLVPVTPKELVTSRNQPVFATSKDWRLELTGDPSSLPRERTLPVSELLVEQGAGGLVLRSRDGRVSFDIIEGFGDVLSGVSANNFKLLPSSGHTPRINFDRLVVCRETWRFAPAELPFVFDKDEAARFVAARRWARAQGIPRFVFVKSPAEIKPSYMDFDSPVLLDLFAKSVRHCVEAGAAPLQISEMIPRLDQTWLHDAEGRSYTSEFRVVALDLTR